MQILRASVLLGYKLFIVAYHISKSCYLYTCLLVRYLYIRMDMLDLSAHPGVRSFSRLSLIVSGRTRILMGLPELFPELTEF